MFYYALTLALGAMIGFVLHAIIAASAVSSSDHDSELEYGMLPLPAQLPSATLLFSHHDLIPPDGVSMSIAPLTVIQEDDDVLMVTISTDVRWIHPGDYVLLDTRGEGRLSILTSLQLESLFSHNPTSW